MSPGSQPYRASGEYMDVDMNTGEIRAARCQITQCSVFLKKLRTKSIKYNCHIICFNADMMIGKAHARSAILHAIRSFKEGNTISKKIEMEALLYASGSRQCTIASSFGIHEGDNNIFVCCFPSQNGVWNALAPLFTFVEEEWEIIDLEKRSRLMQHFGITEKEIQTLTNPSRIADLVLERVALLQISR